MTDPQQGATLHFIVPSPDGGSLLVQAGSEPGALRLPERSIPAGEEMTPLILAAVADLVGETVPPLRVAPIDLTWDHRAADIVVETEAPEAMPLPDGLAWRAVAGIRPADLRTATIREPLGRWLDEQRSGSPAPRRPVWSRPGFVAEASGWMADALEAAGTPLLEPPRLTQIWGLSAFVEGRTATGRVFLKSCAAAFPTEARITLALDRALPGAGPAVVAIEPERRWLLMRDVGGHPLGDEPPERWSAGLVAFGAIQRAWSEAASGLPAGERILLEDRGIARLAERLPRLVDDPVIAALPGVDRARFAAELPRLLDACDELADLGPLDTVVHGDFHPWNVHIDENRVTVIDWSDSAIGHPFLDLPTFLGRTRDVAARQVMLDAYLAGWAGDHDPGRLRTAARLGLVLGCLHQVESYRRILESLDPDDHWDLGSGAPSYVREALVWLDQGLAADLRTDASAT